MSGARAYVGSSASDDGRPDGSIHLLQLDAGHATVLPCLEALAANPSHLALHPDGRTLYAVDEARSGRVLAWRVAPDDPARLTPLGPARPAGGAGPCHLAIDASGSHLLVSNYVDGALTALPIASDGSVGEPSDVVPGAPGGHAHMAHPDPSRDQILVADLGLGEIARYRLDPGRGRWERLGEIAIHDGAGPRHLVVRGDLAYVACELDATVAVVDLRAGVELASVATHPTEPDRTVYPSAIRLSADGTTLYVGNRGPETVARLRVDGAEVEYVDETPCGGTHPRDLDLSPDGRHLVVANQVSGGLAVLPVDGDGGLGAPIQTIPLARASGIAWI